MIDRLRAQGKKRVTLAQGLALAAAVSLTGAVLAEALGLPGGSGSGPERFVRGLLWAPPLTEVAAPSAAWAAALAGLGLAVGAWLAVRPGRRRPKSHPHEEVQAMTTTNDTNAGGKARGLAALLLLGAALAAGWAEGRWGAVSAALGPVRRAVLLIPGVVDEAAAGRYWNYTWNCCE